MKKLLSTNILLLIFLTLNLYTVNLQGQNLNNKVRSFNFYLGSSSASTKQIYGKPKIIEEYFYKATDHFGELKKEKMTCYYIDSFDVNGNLAKRSTNFSDKNTYTLYEYSNNTRVEYYYNNNEYVGKSVFKNNLKIFEISIEDNKSDTTKYFYQNNKVKTILSPHKFFVKEIYTYDKNGNLIAIESYNEMGKLYSKEIKKYNLQNKIIEYKRLSLRKNISNDIEEYQLIQINTFTYHPNGDLKEESFFDCIDERKNIHKYPIQGNKHFYRLTTIDQNIVIIDVTRDQTYLNGRIIKQIQKNEITSIETSTKYEYNLKGDLTQEITYYNDGGIFDSRHEYKYDSVGNLIEIKSYSKDENGIFRKYLSTISEIKYTY